MQTTPRTPSAAPKKRPALKDAIAMLRADHERLSQLFTDYGETRSVPRKKAIVEKICIELADHMRLEEEIFYPAVEATLRDPQLVPEASVEHAVIKGLIADLQRLEPDGASFYAKLTVLSEYVQHHVKEEQSQMFPKMRASSLDLVELGAELAERRAELLAQR